MTEKKLYIIKDNNDNSEKKSKSILWLFFGIIGFICIYFPFYGATLRYQTSSTLSRILVTTGTIMGTIGILMIVFGILGLFLGNKMKAIMLLLMGVIVLYITSLLLLPGTISSSSGGPSSKGYH